MARLTWGAPSERFYESGVDRGVLYANPEEGVVWNGLVSVAENPVGGDPRPTYLDGVKIRNISSAEEFEASIEAFAVPKEFRPCDGVTSIQNGLLMTQQPRKKFSFSYRTMIGSAVQGLSDYKIHIVYNALAAPASKTNQTLNDSSEASTVSWSVTTRPPIVNGHRPTAHLVIDSRETPSLLLSSVEDILYGSTIANARLPEVSELITMFSEYTEGA